MIHFISIGILCIVLLYIYIRERIYFKIYRFKVLHRHISQGNVMEDFNKSSYLIYKLLQVVKESRLIFLITISLFTVYVSIFSILIGIVSLIFSCGAYISFWNALEFQKNFKQSLLEVVMEKVLEREES